MCRVCGLTMVLAVAVCMGAAAQEAKPWEQPGTAAGQEIVGPDGGVMVWVPAGEFLMGSNDGRQVERPQRKVALDGFWMHKHEVTVAQYRKFCEGTSRHLPVLGADWRGQDDHPIVLVDWRLASAYAEWAGLSLPTEAQWEKAARGTDGRTYPWGDTWDAAKCASRNSTGTKLKWSRPVGSYPAGASPYGCLDMAGNAWEWCADRYLADYYAEAPLANPLGPVSGDRRVVRGGSWNDVDASYFRCADRRAGGTRYRDNRIGFRCAKSL